MHRVQFLSLIRYASLPSQWITSECYIGKNELWKIWTKKFSATTFLFGNIFSIGQKPHSCPTRKSLKNAKISPYHENSWNELDFSLGGALNYRTHFKCLSIWCKFRIWDQAPRTSTLPKHIHYAIWHSKPSEMNVSWWADVIRKKSCQKILSECKVMTLRKISFFFPLISIWAIFWGSTS